MQTSAKMERWRRVLSTQSLENMFFLFTLLVYCICKVPMGLVLKRMKCQSNQLTGENNICHLDNFTLSVNGVDCHIDQWGVSIKSELYCVCRNILYTFSGCKSIIVIPNYPSLTLCDLTRKLVPHVATDCIKHIFLVCVCVWCVCVSLLYLCHNAECK